MINALHSNKIDRYTPENTKLNIVHSMFIKKTLYCLNIFLIVVTVFAQNNVLANTGQNSVDFSTLYEYANFSSMAYKAPLKIHNKKLLNNYKISHLRNIPGFEVSYFIATNEATKTQIIAVRGSANIENAIIDIALQLTTDKHTGIRLHNGFSQTAQAIYSEIRPQLKSDHTINTTGHSLGGAVALILAMHLDTDHFNVGKVITFGQPKVTNIAGANKFKHLNITRVVTPKDLIPLTPPFDPMDLDNLDIYWHTGKEVILLPDTNYSVTDGLESMMRAIKFTQEELNENNLEHHKIGMYLELIRNKIPSSDLIPFKNSYNLFNLFGDK